MANIFKFSFFDFDWYVASFGSWLTLSNRLELFLKDVMHGLYFSVDKLTRFNVVCQFISWRLHNLPSATFHYVVRMLRDKDMFFNNDS